MAQEVSLCDYCHLALQEGEATSTLLCMHKVHTTCFLKANCTDSPRYLQCPTCQGPLCPPALLQTFAALGVLDNDGAQSDHGGSVNILEMYNEQETFRTFIKSYHKQLCKVSKIQASLNRLIREEKKKFQENMAEIKEAIQQESKTHQKKIETTDIFKEYCREHRKYILLHNELQNTYHLNRYQLKHHLENLPGLRRWPFPYNRRRNLLKYAFFLRIGY